MTAEQVAAWTAAAIADGWHHRPTYKGEPENSAMTLDTDGGWTAKVISRPRTTSRLNVWGPDALAVAVPPVYDMTALRMALYRCCMCDQQVGRTVRVGFAGRCCDVCLPEARKKFEYPGWAD